jgi:ABC-type uncharacterized transport system fused permease/ATPase subunit
MTARESELEGDYRTAHQRLISNAEEIAFYDGSTKERTIISRLFTEIYAHSGYFLWLKALMGGKLSSFNFVLIMRNFCDNK